MLLYFQFANSRSYLVVLVFVEIVGLLKTELIDRDCL